MSGQSYGLTPMTAAQPLNVFFVPAMAGIDGRGRVSNLAVIGLQPVSLRYLLSLAAWVLTKTMIVSIQFVLLYITIGTQYNI